MRASPRPRSSVPRMRRAPSSSRGRPETHRVRSTRPSLESCYLLSAFPIHSELRWIGSRQSSTSCQNSRHTASSVRHRRAPANSGSRIANGSQMILFAFPKVSNLAPVKIGGRPLAGERVGLPGWRKASLSSGVLEVAQTSGGKLFAPHNRRGVVLIPRRKVTMIPSSTGRREEELRRSRAAIVEVVFGISKRLVAQEAAQRLLIPIKRRHLATQPARSLRAAYPPPDEPLGSKCRHSC